MMVRLTCGPASTVTGVSSTAGSSTDVFHIRLMPRGAFIAVVTRCGRLPCATDSALYRMNQANRSMSVGSPTCILDAGLTHSRQVTANAPARYRASTSQLAHRPPLGDRGSRAVWAGSTAEGTRPTVTSVHGQSPHEGPYAGFGAVASAWPSGRTAGLGQTPVRGTGVR